MMNDSGKLFLVVIMSLLCAFSCSKEKPGTYPGIGDPLPEFSLMLEDGTVLSPSHLKCEDLMLAFFHTECPDCQRELPVMDEFKRKYPKKFVYAVSREESRGDISSYWYQNGFILPYSPQEDRRIYDMFTDSGIPYIVISKKGLITLIFTDRDMPELEELEDAFL